ncbi:MAG: TVP38/TMEM64 family protein [Candidatus Tectomicrobia bacterium]|uniref:TVP38/TMEM64 family membrane protein n=1 Tax=Tectimicrobiota bacterium TaxID=2528274 RepID=A0A933LQQ5_UNCTE|nr:TVP38/TMEM64 family protein [Candidatus Tectomicrobia bacterium]
MHAGATRNGLGTKNKLALLVAFIIVLLIALQYLQVQEIMRSALVWVAHLGNWGPVIFITIYILACVFLLPGSILTLGAGVLFGVLKGSMIVSISSTLGATCAFLVGRYLARDWVSRKIQGYPKFKAIDETVAGEGWKIVCLTRLSPVFPFNLLNYAYGITKVSLRDYFLASWLGMMPGTVMYVYIGSLAGDLAMIGVGARSRPAAEWGLYIVGFVATVVVTIYVTRLAQAALKKRSERPPGYEG